MLAHFVEVVVKVAIIGAGMSGMGASYQFGGDVEHVFIEARDRFGGRITAGKIDGVQVELGATFIHADHGLTGEIAQAYQSFGWKLRPINAMKSYLYQSQIFYEGEEQMKLSHIAKGTEVWNNLCELVNEKQKKTSKPLSLKQAVGDYFETLQAVPEDAASYANLRYHMIANEQGANLTDMGVDECQGKKISEFILMAKGGYTALVHHIWGGLKPKQVHYHQTVTKIDYSGEKVKIYTNNSRVYIAEKAIFTLSLGVLKKNSVQFVPKLSEEQTGAYDDLGFGIYNKVYVSFDSPFWDTSKTWVVFTTKEDYHNRYPSVQSIVKDGKYILCFYVNDEQSKIISNFTEQELRHDMLSFLARFFPNQQIKIRKTLRTSWHLDPYAYGSYTYDRVGKDSQAAIKKICPVLGNKVWFVGEHCHPTLHSFSHAAFLTGMWAAGNITKSLNITKTPKPTKPAKTIKTLKPRKIFRPRK